MQRGNPLTTEGAVRDALDGDARTDAVDPPVRADSPAARPGRQLPVRLTVPLRGDPTEASRSPPTGVHELLVNVNGVPRGRRRGPGWPPSACCCRCCRCRRTRGRPAAGRRADAGRRRRSPCSTRSPTRRTGSSTVPGAAHPARPTTTSPRRFAPSGRLGGLVAALAQRGAAGLARARRRSAWPSTPTWSRPPRRCAPGYQVRGPTAVAGRRARAPTVAGQLAGPAGRRRPRRLRDRAALRRRRPRRAHPRRARRRWPPRAHRRRARQVLSDAAATTPVPGRSPGRPTASLDEPTLDADRRPPATRAVLLSADAVERAAAGAAGVVRRHRRHGPSRPLLTDPLLTRAATAPARPPARRGPRRRGHARSPPATAARWPPRTPSARSRSGRRPPAAPVSGRPDRARAAAPVGRPRAPGPARCSTPSTACSTPGGWSPRGLADVLRRAATAAARRRGPTTRCGRRPRGRRHRRRRGRAGRHATRRPALRRRDRDRDVGLGPDDAFTPLRLGLLRPVSAACRGRPAAAARGRRGERARIDASCAARSACWSRRARTRWARSDAPLLLTVGERAAGDRAGAGGASPARPGCGWRRSPCSRSRRWAGGRCRSARRSPGRGSSPWTRAVRTPGGGLLGPPSRLQVRSTAYGTITVWLTAIAGGLLVVLAARRVFRRVRGEPDQPPRPGPPPRTPGRAPRTSRRTTSGAPPRTACRSSPGPGRGNAGYPGRPAAPGPAGPGPHRPVPPAGPRRPPRPRPGRRPRRGAPAVGRHFDTEPVTDDLPTLPISTAMPRQDGGGSIGRSSSLMAVANLVSRITGFLRQIALVARARRRRAQRRLHRRRTPCRTSSTSCCSAAC